jgi:hypothetical protein
MNKASSVVNERVGIHQNGGTGVSKTRVDVSSGWLPLLLD